MAMNWSSESAFACFINPSVATSCVCSFVCLLYILWSFWWCTLWIPGKHACWYNYLFLPKWFFWCSLVWPCLHLEFPTSGTRAHLCNYVFISIRTLVESQYFCQLYQITSPPPLPRTFYLSLLPYLSLSFSSLLSLSFFIVCKSTLSLVSAPSLPPPSFFFILCVPLC